MKKDFPISRRQFLAVAAAVSAGATFRTGYAGPMPNVDLGERPHQAPDIKVLNPYGRVPVSFVIDDSTCLVNMGHYCLVPTENSVLVYSQGFTYNCQL